MPRDYGRLRTLTTKSIQPSYLATIKGIFFGPTCLVPLSNLQDIVSLGTIGFLIYPSSQIWFVHKSLRRYEYPNDAIAHNNRPLYGTHLNTIVPPALAVPRRSSMQRSDLENSLSLECGSHHLFDILELHFKLQLVVSV